MTCDIVYIRASKVKGLLDAQQEILLASFRASGKVPIIANDVYIDNRFRSESIQLIYGGSGSGKSDWKATELLIKAMTQPYCRVIFVRKVADSIRKSQFQLFKDVIKRYRLADFFKVREQDMTIICKHNDNMLFASGLYDVDRLTSVTDPTDIWMEEPIDRKGSITRADFRELRRRLRTSKASNHIHMTFNPISKKSWIYEDFFQSDDYAPFILKTTYLDNNYTPDWKHDEFEIEKIKDPQGYKIYALGEWGDLKEGLVFKDYGLIDEFPADAKKVRVGLDWGFYPDPTAVVRVGIYGEYLVLDELVYEHGLVSATRAKRLKESGVKSGERIVADRNPEAIEELKRLGFSGVVAATKGPGSILAGLDTMGKFKLLVTRRSKNLREELGNYEWKQDRHTGYYLNEPIDKHNHAIDAGRYGIMDALAQAPAPPPRKHIGSF